MSVGAYILVHVTDRRSLQDAVEKLQKIESLSRWDAVDGDYRIIARFTGANIDELKPLKAVDHSICGLVTGESKKFVFDPDLCHSYALLEVQPDKSNKLVEQIAGFDNTVSCEKTNCNFNIIVVMKGERFDVVDRLIDTRIGNLDGILRIKKTHLISSQSGQV